jgi:hypothetical protein
MKPAILLSVFLLAGLAVARLPEPNNIYYGHLSVLDGAALTGEVDAVLVARVNGLECARDDIAGLVAPGVNYVLRVPLDDGWDALYAPYAARRGDRPVLALLYEGLEFIVDDELAPVAAPGALHQLDIQATPEPGLLLLLLAGLAYAWRRA